MCGITGFIDTQKSTGQTLSKQLETMLKPIIHRGPNDSGQWLEGDVALGHRRLSILELTPLGHQPMISASGRHVIIFNGEIYNHEALREELRTKGAIFRGHSDTEVLLELVERVGITEALKRCIGMFAFAIWDRKEGCLMIARDRLGEKPLYYGWHNGVFLFGSELKSLRAHSVFDAEIDSLAINEYLRWGYIPAPLSIYKKVRKLPPGCWIQVDPYAIKNCVVPEPRYYWSLIEVAHKGKNIPFSGDYEQAVDELERQLVSAVKLQSVADVPVGAFLSGGIDSSTVVALMKKHTHAQVMTFSIGMPDDSIDESRHAALVANHLGTKHVEHRIRPEEALDSILLLPKIWDEPFADSSQVPTYLLSRLARKHVTVALSGDGGDEFFLGYNHYKRINSLWKSRFLGNIPWKLLLKMVAPLEEQKRIGAYLKRARNVADAWKQPTQIALSQHWMNRYNGYPWPKHERPQEFQDEQSPDYSWSSPAEIAALWDARQYLPDDILVKVDRAAMAVSLETRAPLLDHRLIEFALSLPADYRLKGKENKRVLRDVLYRHVPRNLVDRPKQGFSIPIASWLRNELYPTAHQYLNRVSELPNFDQKVIQSMWREHCEGKRDHSERLWGLMILGGFYDQL